VQNVNRSAACGARLTFGTYAVRNVNSRDRQRGALTKCTPADPAPSMQAVDVPA
jgi:hypothetical protein